MYSNEKILIGSNETNEIYILPKLANRHGIIAGATGTGKTVTVKNLAESFSIFSRYERGCIRISKTGRT